MGVMRIGRPKDRSHDKVSSRDRWSYAKEIMILRECAMSTNSERKKNLQYAALGNELNAV